MAGARDDILRAAELLTDRAPSLEAIEHHRLQLVAARRLRATGRAVPARFVVHERVLATTALAVRGVLERMRAAAREPLLVVKGPEAARYYPDPALRDFHDIDVLVADAPAVQRRLVAAGFVPFDDPALYEDIHHLRPLYWPGLPLVVEIHHSPKWVERLDPPSGRELLEAAVPSACGVDGVLALPPAQHAVLLAAHSWAHRPLAKLRDLLDVALVAAAADPELTSRVADGWGVGRVWRTTAAAAGHLLLGGPRPRALRLWARHLAAARERTVLESHLTRLLGGWWGLPALPAIAASASAIGGQVLPENDEGWPAKLGRTGAAVRHASVSKSEHDEALAGATARGE